MPTLRERMHKSSRRKRRTTTSSAPLRKGSTFMTKTLPTYGEPVTPPSKATRATRSGRNANPPSTPLTMELLLAPWLSPKDGPSTKRRISSGAGLLSILASWHGTSELHITFEPHERRLTASVIVSSTSTGLTHSFLKLLLGYLNRRSLLPASAVHYNLKRVFPPYSYSYKSTTHSYSRFLREIRTEQKRFAKRSQTLPHTPNPSL